MLLEELQPEQEFHDSELSTEAVFQNGDKAELSFDIIGDHVYSIKNGVDAIIVAADMGNGHGKVMSVTKW